MWKKVACKMWHSLKLKELSAFQMITSVRLLYFLKMD